MKKTFTEFQSGLVNLQEADVWYPVFDINELKVGDYVRVPDGLVRVVSVPDGEGIFYGEIVTKIHDDVKNGEVYQYTVKETQILGKKKNKNKVSFKDLTQIDDVSIRHRKNEIDINPILEKYMNDAEISKLISKVISSVGKIIKDSKRDKKERDTAREVMDWVKAVKKTYTKTGQIHPNTIRSLMKTVSGSSSKNEKGWGYRTKGWKKSPDGKVPDNFRNEEVAPGGSSRIVGRRLGVRPPRVSGQVQGCSHPALEEGLTQSITRALALRLKSVVVKTGRNVRSQIDIEDKLDILSKQVSAVAGLVLLAVSVSGSGILSKASIVSGIFTEDKDGELGSGTD